MVPNRSGTSSPETWSYTDSVPARPQSAVTASAASGAATQAALRRLLGFDDDESQDIMRKVCRLNHGSISICRHYTNDTLETASTMERMGCSVCAWTEWHAGILAGILAMQVHRTAARLLTWLACCILFWDISTS
jgi:hypothetical protein